MKTKSIFYFLTFTIFFQTSCTSTKDIRMFQDLHKKNTISNNSTPPPKHIIKPYDNLYVSILTLDPNVNILFNPSGGGETSAGNTQYMYGTPASQYINGYRVNREGLITLPILGEIQLTDLSLNEAEEKIKTKAKEYLKEPSVHIKLLNYKVDILGEVNSPNNYYNYEETLNIFEAIGLASGITLYADLKNVIINREIDNKTYTYKVDLTNSDIYKSEVFYLQPNDMVYIPPTKLKSRNTDNSTISILLTTITTALAVFAVIK